MFKLTAMGISTEYALFFLQTTATGAEKGVYKMAYVWPFNTICFLVKGLTNSSAKKGLKLILCVCYINHFRIIVDLCLFVNWCCKAYIVSSHRFGVWCGGEGQLYV